MLRCYIFGAIGRKRTQKYFALQILGPFFWGGLGACIYVLKRVNDEIASFHFDLERFRAWKSRALLGGVLGGTVAYLFEPSITSQATIEAVNAATGAVEAATKAVEVASGTAEADTVRATAETVEGHYQCS